MVVLMTACISAVVWLPVRAQEFSPVVNDRVESGADDIPVIPQSEERRGGLELGAVISAAYSSNIYLSSSDPTSDLVVRIGPTVGYTQGDSKEGEGGFIQVAYRPTGVIYAENHSDSRVDQSLAVAAGWRGKASKLTYTGSAKMLGDATPDTGSQSDRLELANEIRGAWMPREKLAAELAVGGWQTIYDRSDLVDSGRIYGEIAVRYAYSPKTEIGTAYRAGRLEIDGSDSQTIQQVTGSIDWKPREKIHVKLEAGASFRNSGEDTNVTPVLNGRIDWTPSEGTEVFLTAYQREEVSALNDGQIYEVRGITAGFVRRLGGDWTARLEAGYESASYESVKGTGAASRKDRIWFVRPALEYRYSDEFDVSLFFKASDDNSTDDDFSYDEAVTGVELNYQF
jgi:hypothetical protein